MKTGDWVLILHDMNPEFDKQIGQVNMNYCFDDEVVEVYVIGKGLRRCRVSKLQVLDPAVGDVIKSLYKNYSIPYRIQTERK